MVRLNQDLFFAMLPKPKLKPSGLHGAYAMMIDTLKLPGIMLMVEVINVLTPQPKTTRQ